MKIQLAPMEGVVDSVIRHIYGQIGGYDRFVTEFVRVTERLLPDHVFYKYCPELLTSGRTEDGTPVFVQLLGGRPAVLAENADLAVQLGALGIDLNFGCPAKTVNRNDGGATLLKDPHRLFDVISQVKKSVKDRVPVTAKVRLGFDDKSLSSEIALAVKQAGASSLTIHARTRAEAYRPPAHWEYIAQMKSLVGDMPIYANGDIWTVEDYFRCREISGCENVALGRGAIAKPDLARQIKTAVGLASHQSLTWNEIKKDLLPNFFNLSEKYKSPEFAVARTKQWTKFLARNFEGSNQMFQTIKVMHNASEVRNALTVS